MASRPPSAPAAAAQPQQFSLPPYTPEQLFVQRKQAEEIQKDVRLLASLDMARPFTNLQDAAMRLLPFHLFNTADPGLADLDETPDHMGADLMASRHQAWEELSMDKANELRKRAAAASNTIAELEARMSREALRGTNNLDQYTVAKLQQEDVRRKMSADKAELQKLLPPPLPVAAAGASSAAGKASQAAAAAAAGSLLGIGSHAGLQAAVAARGPAGRGQQPLLVPTASMQQQLLLQAAAAQQQLQQYQQQALLQQLLAARQQGQVPQLTLQQQQQLIQQQQQQLLLARLAQQQQQQAQQQAAQQQAQQHQKRV